MTKPAKILDISAMVISTKEFQKRIEEWEATSGWSRMRLANEAAVPYAWLVDVFRKPPQKLDAQRAQQVMAVLEQPVEQPVTMNEVESALFQSLRAIIAALSTQKKITNDLEKLFTHQREGFEKNTQSAAVWVTNQFLELLHSGLPPRPIPMPPQSSRPKQDQFRNG